MMIGGVLIERPNLAAFGRVDVELIARSLGRIVRFAGATDIPVSVLTHSIAVAELCYEYWSSEALAICGLVHDVTECVISDVPRPFKPESLCELEQELLEEFYKAHDLKFPGIYGDRRVIKSCDDLCLAYEAQTHGMRDWEKIPAFAHPQITERDLQVLRPVYSRFPFSKTLIDRDIWHMFALAVHHKQYRVFHEYFFGTTETLSR